MRGSDLRIYYGDARIILRHDDPRVQAILGMVIGSVGRQPEVNVEIVAVSGDEVTFALGGQRMTLERDDLIALQDAVNEATNDEFRAAARGRRER